MFIDHGCFYYQNQLVWDDNITALDNVPQNYEFETGARGFNCTKPLYMSYALMMLSKKVPKPLPPVIDIWKSLSIKSWSLIITSFIVFIFLNKIANSLNGNSRKLKSIFSYIWIYSKPILGIGEDLGVHNWFYILWLLLLFPLIEIVRNDLFGNLIHRDVIFANTIEDLLDGRLTLYTDHYKQGDWINSHFYSSFENNTFKHNFIELTKRVKIYDDFKTNSPEELFILLEELIPKFVAILKKPQELQELFDGIAIVQDETWMDILTTIAPRFAPIHKGQSYLPLLITPLCYNHNFKFGEMAEKLLV